MRIERFDIPDTLSLPGIDVVVEEVPYIGADTDADWSYDSGQIRIRLLRSLGIRRKRFLLYHELTHALNDIILVGLQDHKHIMGVK